MTFPPKLKVLLVLRSTWMNTYWWDYLWHRKYFFVWDIVLPCWSPANAKIAKQLQMQKNNRKKANLNYSEHEAAKRTWLAQMEHHGQTSLTKVYVIFLFWYTVWDKSIPYQKHFIYSGRTKYSAFVSKLSKLPGEYLCPQKTQKAAVFFIQKIFGWRVN